MKIPARIFALLCVLPCIAFASSSSHPSPGSSQLTLAQRIAYQRAIEDVYWQHRIWPKENPGPKPPLREVMGDAAIAAEVEEYLRQSDALEHFWKRPITAEQLQAEMNRMAKRSQRHDILRELFAALDNDPFLIAECLARPNLASRLIRNFHADDQRLSSGLRGRIESELEYANSVESMWALSGKYSESVWEKSVPKTEARLPGVDSRANGLDAEQWDALIRRLHKVFATPIGALPLHRLSSLQEDADRFYVMAILESDVSHLKIATVEWNEQSFDEWWEEAKGRTLAEIAVPAAEYITPAVLPEQTCDDGGWSPTSLGAPFGRELHSAVWTGSEMIVWGGFDGELNFDTGARYDPSTDTWSVINTIGAPEARALPTAVWTGTEMIVWGGGGSFGLLNTGARYNPLTDSWTPTSTTVAPSPRYLHTVVWTGTQMIVWGGWISGTFTNTGARYDPSTNAWTATPLMGAPAARYLHTAVWTGTEMIIWGGDGGSNLNSGGRYNPSSNSWTPTDISTAPEGRSSHSAVWTGTEMIVWGGYGSVSLDTGGRYDPSTNTWSPTDSAGAPTARNNHTAVWTGTEMIIWGGCIDGYFCQNSTYFNSGGRYDPAAHKWTATDVTAAPEPRFYHTAVWTGTEMIVWGGMDHTTHFNSGGRFDPTTNTWTPTNSLGAPSSRSMHTAVWTGAEMIVWGGLHGPRYLNTGGRYDPATDTWTATETSGAPSPRSNYTTVWTGTSMIVWGGYDGTFWQSGGQYYPATNSWTETELTGSPSPRGSHTAVWTGTEMIIWGGQDADGELNTGCRYLPSTGTWTPTSIAGAPSSRYDHTAVWTGSEMIIWGGGDANGPLNTGGRYDPSTGTWTATNATGAPTPRYFHSAVWSDNEMIIWGGAGNGGSVNTGGRYNPATDTWYPTAIFNAPDARSHQSAVWTGAEMIIWGGYNPLLLEVNTGGRYEPTVDIWTPTTTIGAPEPRKLSTGVWTGSEMIVWGGDVGDWLDWKDFNTGGRYCVYVPPAANDDSYFTPQATSLNVPAPGILANDTDPNGNPLTALIVTTTAHGALNGSPDGSFSYSPDSDFYGADSFTYRAFNGMLESDISTVTITVDDLPAASDDFFNADEDTSLTIVAPGILANDTDLYGDPLTALLDTTTAHGTLTLSPDGSFSYSPDANFNGIDSFTYHAHDGMLNGNIATVLITVNPTNDNPVANNDSFATDEDTPLSIATPGVLANDTDIDGDPLNAVLDTLPTNGTLVLNPEGSFDYLPVANFHGQDTFTYHASDGTEDSQVVTVSLTVNSANDPPLAADDAFTTNEATPLTVSAPGILANDTDVEGDPLAAILDNTTVNGVLALGTDGSLTYTPDAGFAGTDAFTYHASDGTADSSIATVTITVDCPLITIAPETLPDATIGAAYSQQLIAGGGPGPFSFAISSGSLPEGLSLDPGGIISGTPLAVGASSFDVTATDAARCGGVQSYTIKTTPVDCLFCDDFEDGVLDTDWAYLKPTWSESDSALTGTPAGKKALAIATPVFAGCLVCYAEAEVITAGGLFNKLWMYGWYVSKANTMELLIKQESQKMILKQRVNGRIVARNKGSVSIVPGVPLVVRVVFDGTEFSVLANGALTFSMKPAAIVPTGTVGFGVKNTTGFFNYIIVNP